MQNAGNRPEFYLQLLNGITNDRRVIDISREIFEHNSRGGHALEIGRQLWIVSGLARPSRTRRAPSPSQ